MHFFPPMSLLVLEFKWCVFVCWWSGIILIKLWSCIIDVVDLGWIFLVPVSCLCSSTYHVSCRNWYINLDSVQHLTIVFNTRLTYNRQTKGVITYKVKKDEFYLYREIFPTNTLKWTVSLFKTRVLNKFIGTPNLNHPIYCIIQFIDLYRVNKIWGVLMN